MQLKNLFVTALAVALSSAQDEEDTETPDLTTLIGDTDSLSSLGALLEAYPDIAEALGSAENVTVFAPNNEAFEALEGVDMLLEGDSADMVEMLLNYHVLTMAVTSDAVTESPQFLNTMYNTSGLTEGQVVGVMLDSEDVVVTSGFKNRSTVVTADTNFTGGVVHIIDSVLTIPENLTVNAAAANLTSLAGALTATELLEPLGEAQDLTIFAPRNDAFQAIGSATGNISTDMLGDILQYHVVNGTVAYSSALGNGSVPTMGGSNVTITVTDGAIFVNGAQVTNPDILFDGGVIHVIDAVLNPENTDQEPEADSPQPAFEGASSGTMVPFTSYLPEQTESADPVVSDLAGTSSTFMTNPMNTGGAINDEEGNAEDTSSDAEESSSEDAAPMVTGAVGAAALFGGAALVANW